MFCFVFSRVMLSKLGVLEPRQKGLNLSIHGKHFTSFILVCLYHSYLSLYTAKGAVSLRWTSLCEMDGVTGIVQGIFPQFKVFTVEAELTAVWC